MQNTWLTQTKFVPPRLRDDFVPRSRLVDSLRASVKSHALTLVSAPAGYGKTTLLASLTDSALAWVSIDEEDNDPARFFISLLNALQKLDSSFGEGIQSLLSSLENPAGEARRITSAFINEALEKLPETLLVFDDLHFISEPVIYSADLILLDISMPLLNGLEAARQLRTLVPESTLIFLTMHASPTYATEAFQAGASGYLLKRSAASELSLAIKSVLQGQHYLTPSLTKEVLDSVLNPSSVERGKPLAAVLTAPQREVLQLVAEGRGTKDIATILNVSVKTVEFHKTRIMQQLDIHTTADLTKYAITHGITGL